MKGSELKAIKIAEENSIKEIISNEAAQEI